MKAHTRMPAVFLCLGAFLSVVAYGQQPVLPCASCKVWNEPQAPFRIFGNTYYVGPHGLTSILITSPAGHVLLDGDLPESVPQIAAHIRTLGFRLEDVKLIANTHAHSDHAGGIAQLQRLSGARVVASPWSAEVFRKGGVGKGDPQYGTISGIAPVGRVQVLHDGENFVVGTITITAHLTPGHTPGGTSWTWRSCAAARCYDLVYADSLTPISSPDFRYRASREYPSALADFETSFHFLETTPCDILLTPHPEASDLWDRLKGRDQGITPDPMIDSGACKQLAAQARERLRVRLATEDQTPAH
jgi:metallo-beta-lactamase class B